MNDLSDFQRRRARQGKIDLRSLDLGRIRRVARWGLWLLALVLAWKALRWSATFYTDWLWFRELGYEAVLLKIVTTRVVLFVLAVALLLGLGLPALVAASRSADRPPQLDAPLEPLDYHFVHKFLARAAAVVVLLVAV
ncbi:MAG: UPF0182 family protein, partial [Gemmatimonadota bacterium]